MSKVKQTFVPLCYIAFLFNILFLVSSVNCKAKKLSLHSSLRTDGNAKHFTINFKNSLEVESYNFEERTLYNRIRRSLPTTPNPISTEAHFNDSHYVAEVHWSGKNSTAIMVLMKDPDSSLNPSRPSYFFVSKDDGKTFENKTELFRFKNGSLPTLTHFYGSKTDNRIYILVAKFAGLIYSSKDECESFHVADYGIFATEVKFHPKNAQQLLAFEGDDSSSNRLFLSRDFGFTWYLKASQVSAWEWALGTAPINKFYYLAGATIYRASSYWSWYRGSPIMSGVEHMVVSEDFVFAIKKANSKNEVDLYVAYKPSIWKPRFVKAEFENNQKASSYVIADASEGDVMVGVHHSGQNTSSLFVSGSQGNKFTLSLERILYYNRKEVNKFEYDHDFIDLHRVKGLKGIYIATTLTVGKVGKRHLKSKITYNKGAWWTDLPAPSTDIDGKPYSCSGSSGWNSNCSLHLSQEYTKLHRYIRHQPIYSKESAPGFIIASGTVGASLKNRVDVFFSRDAGFTWKQVLRGRHYYGIVDHGGVIAAVDQYGLTDTLQYSWDEGNTWKTFKFLDENSSYKLRVYGLLVEPGEASTIFTLFGSHAGDHSWVVVQVDMRNMLGKMCSKDDYKPYEIGSSRNSSEFCLLGMKQVVERRDPNSRCYNGDLYERPKNESGCLCTIDDFQCDFGFEERWVDWMNRRCVPVKSEEATYNPLAVPKSCAPGQYYKVSAGYRRVVGDKCRDGVEKQYSYRTLICPIPESKDYLVYAQKTSITRLDTNSEDGGSHQVHFRLPTGLEVYALDMDYKEQILYFADTKSDTINSVSLRNRTITELLAFNANSTVESLAYDWTANHLYWVDAGSVSISVMNAKGGHRKVILTSGLDKPRSIVVYPKTGYLFYTDWGSQPKIERADMDGLNRQVVVSTDIKQPNGVTIDFTTESLFWTDAYWDKISSCDFHGRGRKDIKKLLSFPYSLAIYNDWMYWNDWNERKIYKASKIDGTQQSVIKSWVFNVMEMKAYSPNSQKGNSGCSGNPCLHAPICLPKPRGYKCACPDNLIEKSRGGHIYCECPAGEKLVGDECKALTTCDADQFTCDNQFCIPKSWQCDDDNDCRDNSDEMNCFKETCAANQFACDNGRCIMNSWKCDIDNDCGDDSDERNCSRSCPTSKFLCHDGRCISKTWLCDGDNDCGDNEDEQPSVCPKPSTTKKSCSSNEFTCATGSCINLQYKCNGYDDCGDNSDEGIAICRTKFTCQQNEFKCHGVDRCVPSSYVCNGIDDCGDGNYGMSSDEACCPTTSKFICSTGWKCIALRQKCDSKNDCSDGSDELECPHGCQTGEFTCLDKKTCIKQSKRCNGVEDCNDGSDEKDCGTVAPPTKVPTCGSQYFTCSEFFQCIDLRKKCNLITDCRDGTDEKGCPTNPPSPFCKQNEFQCIYSKKCIGKEKHCDGNSDCPDDNSDEDNCSESEKCGPMIKSECIFPWKYNDVEFSGCGNPNKDARGDWCATQVDVNNQYVKGNFRVCSEECHYLPKKPCPAEPFGFSCILNSKTMQPGCLAVDKQCDGENNCYGGLDEKECSSLKEKGFLDRVTNLNYHERNGNIQISWTAPADIKNKHHQGYQLQYISDSATNSVKVNLPVDAKSFMINDTNPCQKYIVAVGVKGSNGKGGLKYLWSTINIELIEDRKPSDPRNLMSEPMSPYIEWEEDSGDCFLPIIDRVLQCSSPIELVFTIPSKDVERIGSSKQRKYELSKSNGFSWHSKHVCRLLIRYSGIKEPLKSKELSFEIGASIHNGADNTGGTSSKSTSNKTLKNKRLIWAIPVGVVLVVLMIGIVVMAVKYRRLQHNFLAFAARGSYARQRDNDENEDDLDLDMAVEFRRSDDENQPMINRFSDDEPLVVG